MSDQLDPDVQVELATISNDQLRAIAGSIVFELATGLHNAGEGHIKALNSVVDEALRRRKAL